MNLKQHYAALLIAFCLFSIGSISSAFAQDADSAVTATVTPPFPKPFQKVVITLVSYATDLNRASINWAVEGKSVLSGNGANKLTITMGDVGQTTKVRVTITPPGIPPISKDIFLTPGDVDIVFETVDSYVPPFYRGKALPASESVVRAVAIPDMKSGGVRLKSENLVFQWKRNGNADAANSGFGKNSYIFRGGFAGSAEQIEVVASTVDGTVASQGSRTLTIGEPMLLLYENRPLEGIHYEEALPARLSLLNKEIHITAAPYFFSVENAKKQGISFTWLIDGREVPGTPTDRSALVVRAPENARSVSDIVLQAVSTKRLLQSMEANFSARFDIQ